MYFGGGYAEREKRKARAMVRAHDTRNAGLCLTTAKRDVQRLTRAAQHRYWTNLSHLIQCCADTGDLHGMYQGIKEAICPTSKKTATVLSEDGRPISDPGKQLDRWADHLSALYNKDVPVKIEAINALPADPNVSRVGRQHPSTSGESCNQIPKKQQSFGS